MAEILPILQFFNDEGTVLANGTVTAYEVGTNKLKAVYTSQTGGVQLENPILLNAYGRPTTSGSIWLKGSYTLVVANKYGQVVGNIFNAVTRYNPVDWSTLDTSGAKVSGAIAGYGSPGSVVAGGLMVVDASKTITGLNNLTAVSLTAVSSTKTNIIKDVNGVAAITTIQSGTKTGDLTVVPGTTGNNPEIKSIASGNATISYSSKGTIGRIQLGSFTVNWLSDTSTGKYLKTNGSGIVNLSYIDSPIQLLSNTVNASTSFQASTTYGNVVPSGQTNVLTITSPVMRGRFYVKATGIMASSSNANNGILGIGLKSNTTAVTSTVNPIDVGLGSCASVAYVGTSTEQNSANLYVLGGGSSGADLMYLNAQASTGGTRVFGGVAASTVIVFDIPDLS